MRDRRILLTTLSVLVAACGRLDSPDVQHGAVAGRIPNATTGAYAYVLGAPEILAHAAPDGSFQLDAVPVGTSTVVLFDGAAGAEGLPVTVNGAAISHLEPGRPLKAAAALTVGMSPLGGTRPIGLAFSVRGTPLQQVSAAETGAALLFPIAAGSVSVTATQPGFQDRHIDLVLTEGGSSSFDVDLAVDVQDSRRGCLSCGCDHGLACNSSDGRCYECATNADCGPGGTCTAAHVCSRPAGTGELCDACTAGADCQGAGSACVNPTGGDLTGFCSVTCSGSQACPSGYDCSGNVCTVSSSCVTVTATYGAACTEDRICQSVLKDGKCFPTNRATGVAGYCTARVQAGCPAGFGPDPQGTGYCVRLP